MRNSATATGGMTPPMVAVDKGYDQNVLRERLRELAIRPLIKHRIMALYDHAHNARIDDDRYVQRSMSETVNALDGMKAC